MKLYIGTTKENELVYIEWDKEENKQEGYFSLAGGSYIEPTTEEDGKKKARETLSDSQYWKDIGFLKTDVQNNILERHINFNDVAEDVLYSDGWETTNGEFNLFGEYKGENIYLDFSSCGQHQEEINNFKNLWVEEIDLKLVYMLWDKYHLKPLKEEYTKIMLNFFEKYKRFCSEQEALNKYLEDINY